ncbi:uncharacterized protein BJ212DRAFT_1484575 [Suillus subaureus]|uniref:Uncharacterized protein n=1 Tax=Suillus subaureus TaxID=48587 RepID=A0A9P7E1R6_9AGAM|nr:uncharacterized protein BJ212DRAFT_1484575 [Suillus subaureus]KAG1809083.1 hypothetical protein BJ212DRAFT_1484575 [Suillus subaureus]
MTSNLPPKITPVPAGTPSTEWASKTESLFQPNVVTPDPAMRATSKPEQHPITPTTNLNTPGHEFPGSYPREPEQELQQQSRDDGSEGPAAAASVVQAAKQYIPEPVERTVEYAGQTAAAYLPIPQGVKDSMASYWSNDKHSQPKGTQSLGQQLSTSLPSSELKGAQPHEHVGGVGSLPGTISESSVALLPDERAERDTQRPVRLKKDESQTRGDNEAKSAYPLGAAAVAAKPEPSNLSKDLSSQAQSSQYGTQIDPQQLDKLPTQQTDQCPAKLSDPKPVSVDHTPRHEVPEGQRSDDAETADVGGATIGAAQVRDQPLGKTTESKAAETAGAGGAVGAAGVENKARDNKEVPVHGQEAKVPQQPVDEESTKNQSVENRTGDVGKVTDNKGSDEHIKHTQNAGARTGGYDSDYHPAKLHPPRAAESTDQAAVQPDSPVSPASAPPASVTDNSKERRVSFLDKLRGEAKVIAGKMTGKENKVEEGKRIIHGEV